MIGSPPRKEKNKKGKNSKCWRTHAQGQYDASVQMEAMSYGGLKIKSDSILIFAA